MDLWLIFVILFVLADLALIWYVLTYRKNRFSKSEKRKFQAYWKKIRENPDLKHAVLDADKLLDVILTRKGYGGPLGEKLKKSPSLFSDLDGIWRAHKLRNRIAHELNFSISERDAKQALSKFEHAFRDLGIF